MTAKVLESFEVKQITNAAKAFIKLEEPYTVRVTIQGTTPIIFHAWNCESIEEKANSRKGSRAKKTDDLDSYVRRNAKGEICLPGDYMRGTIVNTARFLPDPRSPRKSAMDLYKAGIIALDELCPLKNSKGQTAKDWDYVDKRRMVVTRAGITRLRPAFLENWTTSCRVQVNLPEYISPTVLNEMIQRAGRLTGLADSRPSYGRFVVVGFDEIL